MNPRISVRTFAMQDLQRIMEIEAASFGPDAYDRNLFAELFHKCGDLFLVAGSGRNIWGYMVTCTRGREGVRVAELISIAVDPKRQGNGVASTMMRNTLRRLQRSGVERFSLMVKVSNDGARRFYEKFGFQKVRKVTAYYEDGTDAMLMIKPIPRA